jgi:Bacteriophage tail sheath protein
MPVNVTYPGVYIEELPSGVHTITGVATSIAAFVGWAPQGPTDSAQLVLSWADYARQYGGLDSRSLLGYAVSQFFSNGGSQAYIIRLVDSLTATTASTNLPCTPAAASLKITANNPGLGDVCTGGTWKNNYGILIKNQSGGTGRFRLQVAYAPSGSPNPPVVVESFENLSITTPDQQGRYVVDIINAQSNLVTAAITGGAPTAPPADVATPQMLSGGKPGTVLTPRSMSSSPADAFETAVAPGSGTGVDFLLHVDLFNLLCVPGEADPPTLALLEKFCYDHRAVLIADCFQDATFQSLSTNNGPSTQITSGDKAANAAFYFPWLDAPDPLKPGVTSTYPPCGFVAGIYAATDGSRGVWKAPAGTEAGVTGIVGPDVPLNDPENGFLNPVAVNCIRNFPVYGTVLWGARTLQGNDEAGSQWKYIPVRRLALYIEESLYRGTKWAVFEPNDEPLWSQLRLNVGAFMHELFRKGAFQGQTPQDAYFVKCDKETTTQNDINLGIVNIVVGFAPLKPAEFVVIQIQQMAGQIAT